MNDELTPEELKQEQALRDELTKETHRLEINQREQLFNQLERRKKRQNWFPYLLPSLSGAVAVIVLTAVLWTNIGQEVEESPVFARIVDETTAVASNPATEPTTTPDPATAAQPRLKKPEQPEPFLEWNYDGRFESQLASARKRLNRISPESKSEKQLLEGRLSALRSNISSLRTRIN